ncbi:MAG: FtsW/RodA/SpoVE family cell cycle protein, partial [Myxococcota bacterium]|nr:FtsW/RodA/SpoVE family cell cycle protein [Myxococcota bacterium]
MRRSRPISEYLPVLALVVIAMLVGVSLISQGNADWYSGDNFYNAQVVWFLIGGLAFIVVAMVDLRLLERLSYVFYGLCIVGLVLTALVGTEVNHSQRWLRF